MSSNPFDFFKDISYDKNYLIADSYTESQYVPYIVNKALALYPDTIFHANEMNINHAADNKMQYDYLFNSIRKKKRFEKWPWKKQKIEDIEFLSSLYNINRQRARVALSILTEDQVNQIKRSVEQGGLISKK